MYILRILLNYYKTSFIDVTELPRHFIQPTLTKLMERDLNVFEQNILQLSLAIAVKPG